jgi:hypothetical protein
MDTSYFRTPVVHLFREGVEATTRHTNYPGSTSIQRGSGNDDMSYLRTQVHQFPLRKSLTGSTICTRDR